jgi:hypothetical protein
VRRGIEPPRVPLRFAPLPGLSRARRRRRAPPPPAKPPHVRSPLFPVRKKDVLSLAPYLLCPHTALTLSISFHQEPMNYQIIYK